VYLRELDGTRRQVARRGFDAADAESRLIAELRRRTRRVPIRGTGFTGEHLFGSLAEEYLAMLDDAPYTEGTKAGIRQMVRTRLLNTPLARTPLGDVKVSVVAHMYRSLADVPGVARNVLIEIRKICDLGVEKDIWPINPARAFTPSRQKRRERKEVPEENQLRDLRAAIIAYRDRPDRFGPAPSNLLLDVIDVILGTSARIGEALGLRWTDIALDDPVPTVTIRGTIVERAGTTKFYQPFTKTAAGARRVPVPQFLEATLRRRLADATLDQEFVFETRRGSPNGPQDVHRALRRVREWAEIPSDMAPHALRRYVATAISEGIDLDTAARTLGHQRATITERYYVARSPLTPDARHVLDHAVPWARQERKAIV
jgi:integrase